MNNLILSFIITSLAGFSTLVGALLIFFKAKKENIIIASSLAFASGVMLSVSITDLIPESLLLLLSNNSTFITCVSSLIFVNIGIIFSMLIDYYLPCNFSNDSLYKLGIISMLAIILHNIPEGIATFLTANKDINLGLSLSVAIALHNIPEGISIAVPIYYSTKRKSKALLYTLVSALSEPFGAILAFIFFKNIITDNIMGYLLSFIAGIMLHISLCELLPNSFKYKKKKYSIFFFVLGILFMMLRFF